MNIDLTLENYTVLELLNLGIKALREGAFILGKDLEKKEVILLLKHVLDCNESWLYAYPEAKVKIAAVRHFQELLLRRLQGEPIAYILGNQDFWNFKVKVSRDVLIPRSDTELLVIKTLEVIEKLSLHKNLADLKILELGTGSGIISIAIGLAYPQLKIKAVDVSAAALKIADENATTLQVSNLEFLKSNWFQVFEATLERFDIIVSNPPYIGINDPHLETIELQYEPKLALIAGDLDGDACLEFIIQTAKQYLVDAGVLLVEHGFMQALKVQQTFSCNNYTQIQAYKDLGGNFRVTCGHYDNN